jgi:asparagine synthase (glutamine-hydrolysing)
MCGIAGIFHSQGSALIDAALLRTMSDVLTHRGPDGSGVYVSEDRRLGLAHRRLAIVDLSDAATQPMSDQTGSVWVTFNGEIYNHRSLRGTLQGAGHRFMTDHSDTEVLIHGYKEWGFEGLLQRLAGMFAFAVWDTNTSELWLARDRIGIKPLYFTDARGAFVFASEIKSLLRYPAVTRDIDPVAMSHYLSFWQTPAPLTMFRGIYKLPAGHFLRVRAAEPAEMRQYWDAVPGNDVMPHDIHAWPAEQQERFYVAGVLDRLRTSVGEHMMSDVPYGAFLSGGVDSTTNVALMREFTDQPINTFSVGFADHTHLNELHHARAVARHFGTNHHEVVVGEADMRGYLDQLVYSQDEPIADWVCIPLYFVSKLTRDHGVTVVQVGEGADEQFSGYDGYLSYLRAYERFWRPFHRYIPSALRMLAAGPAAIAAHLWPGRAHQFDLVERAARGRELFWSNCHIFTDNIKRRVLRNGSVHPEASTGDSPWGLATDAQRDPDTYRLVHELLARFDRQRPTADVLDRIIYLEFKLRLAELLLMRVDKITMSVSLEARVPYLDHRLVEFSAAIPREWKVRNGQPKYILKKAVRGLIPDEVIDRPKMGFGAPMREWMRAGRFLDHVESTIMRSALRKRGLLDYAYIGRLVSSHRTGQADTSAYLWGLYNLSAWYDLWIDQRAAA